MARSVAGAAPSRLNRKFLVVAVLLATLSATLIYAGLSSRRSSDKTSGSGVAQTVVVAKTAIKQRTTITADMLEAKSLGSDVVSTGAFATVDDVIGKVTKFPIEANQQVLSSAVVDTTKPSADALAPVIPDKRRGFSIKATQVLTAGGLLLPGDYVDVIWECCSGGVEGAGSQPGTSFKTSAVVFARPIVQNVQVAAVQQEIVSSGPVGGSNAGGNPSDSSSNPVAAETAKKTPDATTITLLVTPEQANVLLIGENTGELRASLRNPGDQAIVPFPGDTQFLSPGLIPPELAKVLQDAFTQKTTP